MTRDSFSTEVMCLMIAQGLKQAEVAERLGVTRGAVVARMKREGLEWPSRRRSGTAQAFKAAKPRRPSAEDDAASLAATGGRYTALCDWARARGLSHTQALQRWHRLRLPAVVRRP